MLYYRFELTKPDKTKWVFPYETPIDDHGAGADAYWKARKQLSIHMEQYGLALNTPGVKLEHQTLQFVATPDSWYAGGLALFPAPRVTF